MRPFGKTLRSTREIKDDIRERTQRGNELVAVASTRELEPEETNEWNKLFADHGEVDVLQEELSTARDAEAEAKARALYQPSREPLERISSELKGSKMSTQLPLSGPLKAFRGENAKEHAYASGKWLMASIARSRGGVDSASEGYLKQFGEVYNVATVGTDADGGYTVPTPLSAAIIDYRDSVGVSRQTADVRTMSSMTLQIPKQVSGTVVKYPGEAGTIDASQIVWDQLALTAEKRAVFSQMSNELRDDSIIDQIDHLAMDIGYELAKNEDREYIVGDGTGASGNVTGLVPALGAGGTSTAVANWGAVTLDDLTGLMGLLPSKFTDGTSWICSSEFYYSVMVKLLSAAGGNDITMLEAGAARPTFLGKPVYLTSQMPIATAAGVCLLYGNFRKSAIVGDRLGIDIAWSEHFAFQDDLLSMRGISRYDILVHEPGDATDPGAYVGLDCTA